ncbi:MAG: urease accessory protein UreE [Rhizonema sp. PD37]|nr:urease accessory protein UreE [Rhizonema sp. PD37]
MLTFTQYKHQNPDTLVALTLALTAEQRSRSRHRFETEDGQTVFLRLPRGTVLRNGDLLLDETNSSVLKILAKPEPVLTVIAQTPLDLLRAAYHLGNRHVPVEITPTYLRLSTDPVLSIMLEQLGIEVKEEIVPFQPEAGAYGDHSHT